MDGKFLVFWGVVHVDRRLVLRLRSEIRNSWAHAPNHEMTEAQLDNAFDVAMKFIDNLEKVFADGAVTKCK